MQSEMLSASSWIRTRVVHSIYYDDICYAKRIIYSSLKL